MAAGIPVMRRIPAPEPVENLFLILGGNRCPCVEHTDLPLFSPGCQADPDPSALLRILQGIGEQDHCQLLDHFLIAAVFNSFRDLCFQAFSGFINAAFEGKNHIQQGMSQVKLLHFCPGVIPVQPCQGQQVLYKGIRPADFRTDITQVFIFTDLLFQHFGIGGNHGKRRLQFMAGIRYELFLAGKGFFHRSYHAPDQEGRQQGQQDAGNGCNQDHGTQRIGCGKEIQPGIQHQQLLLPVSFGNPVKLCPDPAAVLPVSQDFFRHSVHLLIRIQVCPFGGPGRHCTVLIQRDGIGIAQLGVRGLPAVPDLGRLTPAAPLVPVYPATPVIPVRFQREHPGIFSFIHYGKRGFRLCGNVLLAGQIDSQHNSHRDQNQDPDDDQGHTQAKPSDHFSSSREYPTPRVALIFIREPMKPSFFRRKET